MMWPLLAASIVTIAIAVERTVFYRRSASDMQVLQGEFLSAVRAKNFDAAAALCKKAGGTVGAVLEKAIAERNAVSSIFPELRLTAQRGSRIISTM